MRSEQILLHAWWALTAAWFVALIAYHIALSKWSKTLERYSESLNKMRAAQVSLDQKADLYRDSLVKYHVALTQHANELTGERPTLQ